MIIKNIKKAIKISKKGSPYASISLQVEEYKDGKGNMKWIGGFGNKRSWAWKVGDDVQLEVKENGKYLNFEFGENEEPIDVYRLPATVGFVLELLKAKVQAPAEGVDSPSPEAENQDADTLPEEDIPFK